MPFDITIQGTTIPFPESAEDPNWAPALVLFAQVVADALAVAVGAYDVSPQVMIIDSYNGSGTIIPGLAFPISAVQGAIIRYSVYRTTNSTSAGETGIIEVNYNPNNPTNQKWEIIREYVGNGEITFTIADNGQVSFETNNIAGSNHVGVISFAAQTLTQS